MSDIQDRIADILRDHFVKQALEAVFPQPEDWPEEANQAVAEVAASAAAAVVAELGFKQERQVLRQPPKYRHLDDFAQTRYVTEWERVYEEDLDLRARLKAFATDCVTHGDMTPAAQRILDRILDKDRPSGRIFEPNE